MQPLEFPHTVKALRESVEVLQEGTPLNRLVTYGCADCGYSIGKVIRSRIDLHGASPLPQTNTHR
jgi:hypothetical protein